MRAIKTLCLLLAILTGKAAGAQELPYEQLDSLSAAISSLQSTAENSIYFDGADNYTLKFPEQNFGLLLHNMKAYNSVCQRWDGGSSLAVTENVDLSKATGITYRLSTDSKASVIRLYFPPGHLKTQYFEDGMLTNTVSQEFLPFYCSASGETLGHLYGAILKLYFSFKVAAGHYTTEQVQAMGTAFSQAMASNTRLAYMDFLQAHPDTIWTRAVQEKLKELK